MKKLLLTATLSTFLVGMTACDSSDTERRFNQASDFSQSESEDAADLVHQATLDIATSIYKKCTNDSVDSPTLAICSTNDAHNPELASSVNDSDSNFTIKISGDVITVTFNDAGDYLTHNDGDKLKISYSDEGGLDHFLKVDASTLATPTVSFDGEFIINKGSFNGTATNMALNPSSSLTGNIKITTKDHYTFSY